MPNVLANILTVMAMLLTPVADQSPSAADQEVYDSITVTMTDIRDLELKHEVQVRVVSRQELQEEQQLELETGYPAEDQANDVTVLVAFGFIEPDTDIGALYSDLLGEQVLGYYDPATADMVVVSSNADGELSATDQATYAHEIVHALQDQHFNLDTFMETRQNGTSDESLAITALIEGDATLAQIEFLIADPELARAYLDEIDDSGSSTEVFDSAPAIFADTLIFPYVQGQEFAQEIYDEGGWEAVDAAYANPPTTTEQILHPEKYMEGEKAIAVDIPELASTLGTGWTMIDQDTMGELQTSILLDDGSLKSSQVRKASEGWGGDTYQVCQNGDEVVIDWATAWDSEDDAEEFFKAIVVRESERLGVEPESDGDSVTLEGDGVVVRIVRDGSSVQYIQAPTIELAELVESSHS